MLPLLVRCASIPVRRWQFEGRPGSVADLNRPYSTPVPTLWRTAVHHGHVVSEMPSSRNVGVRYSSEGTAAIVTRAALGVQLPPVLTRLRTGCDGGWRATDYLWLICGAWRDD